jgi:hypothetical protein
MKIICFKPSLHKWWKNGWSSEEVWKVNNSHWGFISNDFYKKLQIFQHLFTGKLTEADRYIVSQVRSDMPLTEEENAIMHSIYKDDIEAWKNLQEGSGLFYNTVCEFIAQKPGIFSKKYIRCACYMGRETVQVINFKWIKELSLLKIKCWYSNYQLKKYYKLHPFKYYQSYYPGIEKDKKKFFQHLSVTLSKILNKENNGK